MATPAPNSKRIRELVVLPGFLFTISRAMPVVPGAIIDHCSNDWDYITGGSMQPKRRYILCLYQIFTSAADYFSVRGHDDEKGWQSILEAAPFIANIATESGRLNSILQREKTEAIYPYTSSFVEAALLYGPLRQLYLDHATETENDQYARKAYGFENDLDLLYDAIKTYNEVKSLCKGQVRDLIGAHRLGFDHYSGFDDVILQPMFDIRAELCIKSIELEESNATIASLRKELGDLKSKDQNIEEERRGFKRKLAEAQDQRENIRKKVRKALDEDDT